MGFLDRLFGHHRPHAPSRLPGGWGARTLSEEQALQRYRYLVRTAPPEALEEMFLEAFSRLQPHQREQAAAALDALLPAGERRHGATLSDPRSLARRATRAELLQPGTVERAFGGLRLDGGAPSGYAQGRGYGPGPQRGWGGGGLGMSGGLGMGGLFAGSLLRSLVGTVVGSMVAHQFLDGFDAHAGLDADGLIGGGDDFSGGDFGDGGFGEDL